MHNIKFNFFPSFIDNSNFNYLKVDDKYIASLVIYDYPVKIYFTQIINSIEKKYMYDVSIYIQKLDTLKVLKDISYNLSNYKSELKTTNKNQIDIDLLNKQQIDSKELRKQIQLNNEEVYKFNLFITFYSYNKDELFKIIKNFQSKLFSKQIYSNISNFRNLDSYILTLPINNYDNILINKNYRNITTSTLSNIFPFYTRSAFDKNGIIFGYTKNENKLSIIDIFDRKYINSNIIILGSSGSGKSYFTKLIVLRHFLKGKIQYIFDIEGEYNNLAEKLNINLVRFGNKNNNKFINIMDINEGDIEIYESNVLKYKIQEIIDFISIIVKLNNNDKKILKDYLIKVYLEKNITYDINSLYIENTDEKIFIEKKLKKNNMFPNMYDLLNEISENDLRKKIKYIVDEYSEFSNYSNINLDTSVVFDTSFLTYDKMKVVVSYLLNKINKYLRNNRLNNDVIIYVDELWKYINNDVNGNIAKLICSLYKSIRKNKASIVTITQDISDFFSINKGNYGKVILNNSEFKVFFKLEYSDSEVLSKLNVIAKDTLKDVSRLEKGSMLLGFCNNNTVLKVKASNYEDEIIEGENNEYIGRT